MLKKFSVILIIIFASITNQVIPAENDKEKKEKVRYAIESGILSIYDIPFDTYVNLKMWDEIRFILEANNKNIVTYELPGVYYSRPFLINDAIWVFENNNEGIFIFNPDTLELNGQTKNKDYSKYDGGVKKILRSTVISGGSDEDVDTAVIWDTDSNEIRTVKLQEGHYVSSIEMDEGRLYIGSCGGLINVWKYDEWNDPDLEFSGTYSSSEKENTDWNIFNQKECITGIRIVEDKIIGVGEKTIFVWNTETRTPIRTYSKSMTGSLLFFHENYMIEYKGNKFVIRNLENGKKIKEVSAEKQIEDLIVTSEKIFADYDGDLLIVTLRHNQGICFYDFKKFNLIKKMDVKGKAVTAYKNTLFATDDNHLYKYDIINKAGEKYDTFVKRIESDKIILTEDNYYPLSAQLKEYPKVLKATEISEKFLKIKKITLHQTFKYGKIGERFVPYNESVSFDGSDKDGKKGFKEDIQGYKAIYDIKNNSDQYYLITLAAIWSGVYGSYSPYEDAQKSLYSQSFFIAPNGGRFSDQIELGEKEPAVLVIYPESVESISETYYHKFMKAISKNNEDIKLINPYLEDKLVKAWHDKLKKRKDEIIREQKGRFWLFRLFQIQQ